MRLKRENDNLLVNLSIKSDEIFRINYEKSTVI
jgi:hypothetical protein